ncbi:hypothetical protein BDQ17DRAFT_631258 [Cyathus striatus]|nr:hypothetical protein BDQ17DRAFT_631258 [Cyathus striatus]
MRRGARTLIDWKRVLVGHLALTSWKTVARQPYLRSRSGSTTSPSQDKNEKLSGSIKVSPAEAGVGEHRSLSTSLSRSGSSSTMPLGSPPTDMDKVVFRTGVILVSSEGSTTPPDTPPALKVKRDKGKGKVMEGAGEGDKSTSSGSRTKTAKGKVKRVVGASSQDEHTSSVCRMRNEKAKENTRAVLNDVSNIPPDNLPVLQAKKAQKKAEKKGEVGLLLNDDSTTLPGSPSPLAIQTRRDKGKGKAKEDFSPIQLPGRADTSSTVPLLSTSPSSITPSTSLSSVITPSFQISSAPSSSSTSSLSSLTSPSTSTLSTICSPSTTSSSTSSSSTPPLVSSCTSLAYPLPTSPSFPPRQPYTSLLCPHLLRLTVFSLLLSHATRVVSLVST